MELPERIGALHALFSHLAKFVLVVHPRNPSEAAWNTAEERTQELGQG